MYANGRGNYDSAKEKARKNTKRYQQPTNTKKKREKDEGLVRGFQQQDEVLKTTANNKIRMT